ncbi:MAG: two-component sensor histidine kinase [Clostridiales bacterium]|nr:two-component sensor histidine kinase [Clostridiales bacterium]
MIGKLRRKFVLINMLLVTSVLIVVFSAMVVSDSRQLAAESREAMEMALRRDIGFMPKIEISRHAEPPSIQGAAVFVVEVDQNRQIFDINLRNVEISEEDLVRAVSDILDSDRSEGILSDAKLRYLKISTPVGTKIAFSDYRYEQENMTNRVLSALLFGVSGLLAFFGISVFLSRWALAPVEKAWKKQQRFVSDASHELKTPLTVILADTDIVLSHAESKVSDETKWLHDIRFESKKMKTLVEQMLFLARADEKAPKPATESFSLDEVLWSALLPFESVAFEKNVKIENHIDASVMTMGSREEIGRLITILLDNAIKYARSGGTVTVTLDRQGDKPRLRVHNTDGIIESGHLDKIFDRFYRADPARSDASGGFGLGLSIAKSIADRNKAVIRVESTPESGTTFTVIFGS